MEILFDRSRCPPCLSALSYVTPGDCQRGRPVRSPAAATNPLAAGRAGQGRAGGTRVGGSHRALGGAAGQRQGGEWKFLRRL
jgi:hypothetical protein